MGLKIVFCTTCKNRLDHIKQTLPQNLKDNQSYLDLKFILLDYNSLDELDEYVKTNHKDDIASGRLNIYRFAEPGLFKMAHAKNLAHRLGIFEGADVLVNIDADNFTGLNFAEYVANQFKSGDRIFLWSKMIKEGPNKLVRGISGRIAVTKNAFLETGGYDEIYETYGPDDKNFNQRLQSLGYEPREIDLVYLRAIHHNSKVRFREYPHVTDSVSEELEGQILTQAIANFGKVGLGVVFKNYCRIPFEVGPIPTRIFGIGMHKTGTYSLHQAFNILGLESTHWTNLRQARTIWEQIKTTGQSEIIERNYAASDLLIGLLYKELDKSYPGSKFILTVRNEDDWLLSVQNHWGEKNRWRAEWDNDCFSHKMHTEVYGRKTFDKDIFLERYRRHNQEVINYFKGRKNDLLVLDMSKPVDWYELCSFLRQDLLTVPYLKENVTI